jgi:hypothetical protein
MGVIIGVWVDVAVGVGLGVGDTVSVRVYVSEGVGVTQHGIQGRVVDVGQSLVDTTFVR